MLFRGRFEPAFAPEESDRGSGVKSTIQLGGCRGPVPRGPPQAELGLVESPAGLGEIVLEISHRDQN
jgi:hypothetical protein